MAHTSIISAVAFAAAVTAALVFSTASAQREVEKTAAPEDRLAENFRAEHEIGRRFH